MFCSKLTRAIVLSPPPKPTNLPFQYFPLIRTRQGRSYTDFYLRYYETKYIAKYIRKRAKEGLGFQFYAEEVKSISSALADFMLKSGEVQERDTIIQELKRILTELDAKRVRNNPRGCCFGCHDNVVEYQERSLHGRREPTHTFADLIVDGMEGSAFEGVNRADLIPTLQAIASYSISIHKACIKNVGLDHGKVREVRCEKKILTRHKPYLQSQPIRPC